MIYLLLPAYNEAEGILELLREIDAVRNRLKEFLCVVVVDDGSTDGTGDLAETMLELGQPKPEKLVVLRHPQNRGLKAALLTGLDWILKEGKPGDLVAAMDADLSHDPVYLLDLAAKAETGFDVVVASRFAQGGQEIGVNAYRHVLSAGAGLAYRIFAPWMHVHDVSCGYRMIRWDLLRKAHEHWGEHLLEAQGFACTGELLLKLAALTAPDKVTEIPFTLRYDAKQSESKMPTVRTIMGTLSLLLKAHKIKHTID